MGDGVREVEQYGRTRVRCDVCRIIYDGTASLHRHLIDHTAEELKALREGTWP